MTDIFDVLEVTWPAARTWLHNGWTLHDGAGGGKRVSAATLMHDGADIEVAARAMSAPLFMVRDGQAALDSDLAAAGYSVVDPTLIYACPTDALIERPLPLAQTYAVYPPLYAMTEIWDAGGIGQARLAIMDRVQGPKTAILGRNENLVAGAAFVAIHKDAAMIHAIEVSPDHRRQGVAKKMIWQAAHWANLHKAVTFNLAVTRKNKAANALYASMGFQVVGQYHYRCL